MDEPQLLAERFEEHRPHMRAVAYRMLGSINEADDAVQETWLRFSHDERTSVQNLGGWLTTVAAQPRDRVGPHAVWGELLELAADALAPREQDVVGVQGE
jgi:hypothetical protein